MKNTCFLPLFTALILCGCTGKTVNSAKIETPDAWSSANQARYSQTDFTNAVWHETFADGKTPFTVEYHNGATGKVSVVKTGGRSETHALQTIKSNDKGFILIKFNKQIPVTKGAKLQFNAFYQGIKNSALYSKAMLRMQTAGQKDFKLFSFYPGITGGDRMQEIIATPPATWERKFTQRKAESGMDYFEPVLILAGAPSEAIWDDFYIENDNISAENWNNFFNRRQPVDRSSEMISKEDLQKKIAAEPDHTGKVVRINGKSRLLIDGKITAPVINGPYGGFVVGKSYSNVKDFGAIGVNLSKVSIRLGEGFPAKTYRGCWKSKDQLDLSGAVEQISNSLRLNPNARIILSITLHPYWNFTKDFPGEAWLGYGNKPVYGSGIHINESLNTKPNANRYIWPSYQSEILKDLYKKQIAKIINELKRTGLSKYIVGLHIGGGHDNQMVVTHFDYSRPSIKAFRKFLKDEYGSVDNLRKAWRDPSVTFENAQAPGFTGSDDCLYPEKEQNRIDFFRYNKTAGWRMADEIGEFARKLMGKEVFTMRWCMGAYSGNPGSSLDIYDFLVNQKFDILVAQPSYNMRPPSSPTVPKLPLDSFHLHGKIYTDEFDIRTWNAAPSWEKEIMSISWGLMIDSAMWQSANRKLAGTMFARDMGFWYLDMAPGWFNHEAILQDIKSSAKTGQMLAETRPSAWHPDAALVIDDDAMFLRNLPSPQWMFDMTMLIPEQFAFAGSAGVPFACYSLNDLLADPELAKSFKVLIFGAMYKIDARRAKLLESLKNNNRTLIFLSGTGRLLGSEVTGFKIVAGKRSNNHHVIAEPEMKFNVISPWMNKKDVHPQTKPAWYDNMRIVYAEPGDGVKVLARFAANNKPAIAEKNHGSWKGVYIGESGGLSPEYFNHLARQAGAYAAAESGYQCETNGNFMMVHCLKGGNTTFKMPFKADVVNLFNNRTYSGVTEIPVAGEAGSTYWFKLTPSEN